MNGGIGTGHRSSGINFLVGWRGNLDSARDIVYTIYTMLNITFSADERLIEQARAKARRENRTLNDVFRDWLASYTGKDNRLGIDAVRAKWKHVKISGPFGRDDMHERR